MFNPLFPFTKQVLQATVAKGINYFVRNTFTRAKDHFDEGVKGYFLITHYADKAKADAHYKASKNDGNRYLYDWQDEEDKKKLLIAAGEPEGFRIFSTYFKPDYKKLLTDTHRDRINTYMYANTDWKPKRGQNVNVDFYMQFGYLYATLSFQHKELTVKFDEIEGTI